MRYKSGISPNPRLIASYKSQATKAANPQFHHSGFEQIPQFDVTSGETPEFCGDSSVKRDINVVILLGIGFP
jgi:hypothetical protein